MALEKLTDSQARDLADKAFQVLGGSRRDLPHYLRDENLEEVSYRAVLLWEPPVRPYPDLTWGHYCGGAAFFVNWSLSTPGHRFDNFDEALAYLALSSYRRTEIE